jgi:hypothetical protein
VAKVSPFRLANFFFFHFFLAYLYIFFFQSYIGDLLRDVDEGNKERGTNEIQQIKTSSVFLNFLTNLQTKYAIVEVLISFDFHFFR